MLFWYFLDSFFLSFFSLPWFVVIFASSNTIMIPFEDVQNLEQNHRDHVDPVGYDNFQLGRIFLDKTSDEYHHQHKYYPNDNILCKVNHLLCFDLVWLCLFRCLAQGIADQCQDHQHDDKGCAGWSAYVCDKAVPGCLASRQTYCYAHHKQPICDMQNYLFNSTESGMIGQSSCSLIYILQTYHYIFCFCCVLCYLFFHLYHKTIKINIKILANIIFPNSSIPHKLSKKI